MQSSTPLKNSINQETNDTAAQQPIQKHTKDKKKPLIIFSIVIGILLLISLTSIGAYMLGEKHGETQVNNNIDTESDLDDNESEDNTSIANDTDDDSNSDDNINGNNSDTIQNNDLYEGWQEIELTHMGYKAMIPESWSYEETKDSGGLQYQVIFMDSNSNQYRITPLCQLGDCGCEYQSNQKTLFTFNYLDKSDVNMYIAECYTDLMAIDMSEPESRSLFFTVENSYSQYGELGFGHNLDDTESSLDELRDEYSDLKKILESFETI